jgi:Icc-related predicted phosphoesterase
MLVLGDAHADAAANRAALLGAYEATDADLALQTGDLLHYDLPAPTWFIAGNNEDFDVISALRAGDRPSGTRNAHLLASDAVEQCGLRIAGLSGNYAPTQYQEPRDDLAPARRRHFVRADIEKAKALTDIDVCLTHESPNGVDFKEDYDVGCVHINELLEAIEPHLCLVGHHHEHLEDRFGSTRVIGLDPVWDGYYELDPATLTLERYDAP